MEVSVKHEKSVAVAQLGARMHYAVPKLLFEAGRLEKLYTDLYAGGRPWRALGAPVLRPLLPAKAKVLLARDAELPARKVRSFQRFGLQYLWRYKRSLPRDVWKVHLWAVEQFNRLIIEDGLTGANCVYGFRTASRLLFEFAARAGLQRVLEQCSAPAKVEDALVGEEYSRWPGWENAPSHEKVIAYDEVERAEWDLADLILCPSEFVKRGIQQARGPADKCVVVPYGVQAPRSLSDTVKQALSKPLRVLFVGQVRLLKGIGYLLQAMRQFTSAEAVCRVVGPIKVSREKLQSAAPPNVSLLGSIARTEMARQYAWADVFCLPTLCEGSATVIYEALASGLPVITTSHSGSLIRDCENGRNIIVPIRDPDAIAAGIRTVAKQWRPASECSEGTELAASASMASYSQALLAALGSLSSGPASGNQPEGISQFPTEHAGQASAGVTNAVHVF